MNRILISTKM